MPWHRAALSLSLLLIATLLWRLHSQWPSAWLAILAATPALSGIALARGLSQQSWFARILPLCAALILILPRFPGAWPCEISCADAQAYATLLGLPIALFALPLLLVLAALAKSAHRQAPFVAIAAGASLGYLGLSVLLGLLCGACLASHGFILALVAQRFNPGKRQCIMLIITLISLSAALTYDEMQARQLAQASLEQHHPLTDKNSNNSRPATKGGFDIQAADRGRRLGSLEAPFVLELKISVNCAHCRGQIPGTLIALKDLIDAGRLSIIFRHLAPRPDASSSDDTLLALAAAGRDRYRPALALLWASPQLHLEDWLEDSALALAIEDLKAHRNELVALQHRDNLKIKKLGMARGALPQARLLQGDTNRGYWPHSIEVDAIRQAIAAAASSSHEAESKTEGEPSTSSPPSHD